MPGPFECAQHRHDRRAASRAMLLLMMLLVDIAWAGDGTRMRLKVRTGTRSGGSSVMYAPSVADVKAQIQSTEDLPPDQQRLIFSGDDLDTPRSSMLPENFFGPTMQMGSSDASGTGRGSGFAEKDNSHSKAFAYNYKVITALKSIAWNKNSCMKESPTAAKNIDCNLHVSEAHFHTETDVQYQVIKKDYDGQMGYSLMRMDVRDALAEMEVNGRKEKVAFNAADPSEEHTSLKMPFFFLQGPTGRVEKVFMPPCQVDSKITQWKLGILESMDTEVGEDPFARKVGEQYNAAHKDMNGDYDARYTVKQAEEDAVTVLKEKEPRNPTDGKIGKIGELEEQVGGNKLDMTYKGESTTVISRPKKEDKAIPGGERLGGDEDASAEASIDGASASAALEPASPGQDEDQSGAEDIEPRPLDEEVPMVEEKPPARLSREEIRQKRLEAYEARRQAAAAISAEATESEPSEKEIEETRRRQERLSALEKRAAGSESEDEVPAVAPVKKSMEALANEYEAMANSMGHDLPGDEEEFLEVSEAVLKGADEVGSDESGDDENLDEEEEETYMHQRSYRAREVMRVNSLALTQDARASRLVEAARRLHAVCPACFGAESDRVPEMNPEEIRSILFRDGGLHHAHTEANRLESAGAPARLTELEGAIKDLEQGEYVCDDEAILALGPSESGTGYCMTAELTADWTNNEAAEDRVERKDHCGTGWHERDIDIVPQLVEEPYASAVARFSSTIEVQQKEPIEKREKTEMDILNELRFTDPEAYEEKLRDHRAKKIQEKATQSVWAGADIECLGGEKKDEAASRMVAERNAARVRSGYIQNLDFVDPDAVIDAMDEDEEVEPELTKDEVSQLQDSGFDPFGDVDMFGGMYFVETDESAGSDSDRAQGPAPHAPAPAPEKAGLRPASRAAPRVIEPVALIEEEETVTEEASKINDVSELESAFDRSENGEYYLYNPDPYEYGSKDANIHFRQKVSVPVKPLDEIDEKKHKGAKPYDPARFSEFNVGIRLWRLEFSVFTSQSDATDGATETALLGAAASVAAFGIALNRQIKTEAMLRKTEEEAPGMGTPLTCDFANADKNGKISSIPIFGLGLISDFLEKMTIVGFSMTFPVFGVPVTVRIALEGMIRLNVDFSYCNRTLQRGYLFGLKPSATLQAVLQGGLGFPGISVGLGIDLDVLRLDTLPAVSFVLPQEKPELPSAEPAVGEDLSQAIIPVNPVGWKGDSCMALFSSVSTLNGRVYGYAQFAMFEARFIITEWSGPKWSSSQCWCWPQGGQDCECCRERAKVSEQMAEDVRQARLNAAERTRVVKAGDRAEPWKYRTCFKEPPQQVGCEGVYLESVYPRGDAVVLRFTGSGLEEGDTISVRGQGRGLCSEHLVESPLEKVEEGEIDIYSTDITFTGSLFCSSYGYEYIVSCNHGEDQYILQTASSDIASFKPEEFEPGKLALARFHG